MGRWRTTHGPNPHPVLNQIYRPSGSGDSRVRRDNRPADPSLKVSDFFPFPRIQFPFPIAVDRCKHVTPFDGLTMNSTVAWMQWRRTQWLGQDSVRGYANRTSDREKGAYLKNRIKECAHVLRECVRGKWLSVESSTVIRNRFSIQNRKVNTKPLYFNSVRVLFLRVRRQFLDASTRGTGTSTRRTI